MMEMTTQTAKIALFLQIKTKSTSLRGYFTTLHLALWKLNQMASICCTHHVFLIDAQKQVMVVLYTLQALVPLFSIDFAQQIQLFQAAIAFIPIHIAIIITKIIRIY